MIFEILTVYLILINVFATIICIFDKLSARHGGRRISEKSLILISVLGGSIFMYFTMKIIRHKTKHKKFMIGLPLIILIQSALIITFLKIFS